MAKKKAKVIACSGAAEATETSDKKYSENPSFLQKAFSHYLDGCGCNRIVELMRPNWPEVSLRTLQRIASENGWQEARAALKAKLMSFEVDARVILQQIILDLQSLQRSWSVRGVENAQDTFAFVSLCTSLKDMLEKDNPIAITSDEHVKAFVAALQKHPKIGPLMRKHREEIREAMEAAVLKTDQESTPKSGGKRR